MANDNTRDARGQNSADNTPQQDGSQRTESGSLDSAPPGSSIINSTRSGQAVSENPVIRARRDAGDVLADNVREGEEGDPDQENRSRGS